ncbi:MAG: hypothetical protein PVI68_22800, partial [Anaerolineae bacterium]
MSNGTSLLVQAWPQLERQAAVGLFYQRQPYGYSPQRIQPHWVHGHSTKANSNPTKLSGSERLRLV